MQGAVYYLIIKDNYGRIYYKYGPKTLKEIDEETSKYSSEKEYIIQKEKEGISLPFDNVCINIYTKTKDEYKSKRKVLYGKKFDENKFYDKLKRMLLDQEFLKYFLSKYRGLDFISKEIANIDSLILTLHDDSGAAYELSRTINSLLTKLCTNKQKNGNVLSYTKVRDVYFKTLDFNNISKKNKVHVSKEDLVDYKMELEKRKKYTVRPIEGAMTKKEKLSWLKEHDRELLDIDDFTGYEGISPFDGSKNGKSK